MSRVYILGIDGYLGWRLREYLLERGHQVAGCDNFFRRDAAESLVPIIRPRGGNGISGFNVNSVEVLKIALRGFEPDVIVHFAEIPSAPYSMSSFGAMMQTQQNNVLGSLSVLYAIRMECPAAHLIKLGSMGEYCPSSWYHMSKVLDSENCKYAADLWNLRITDVMQGPVYGVGGRFDYDEIWGTVINRWVAMGLAGHNLLVYGDGKQVRAFLPIEDSMQCFAVEIMNPPEPGEYRVVNQYAKRHTLNELAGMTADLCGVGVDHIENPRVEKNSYSGATGNEWLQDHGYEPTEDTYTALQKLVEHVRPYKERIDPSRFAPKVRW